MCFDVVCVCVCGQLFLFVNNVYVCLYYIFDLVFSLKGTPFSQGTYLGHSASVSCRLQTPPRSSSMSLFTVSVSLCLLSHLANNSYLN